MRTVVAVHAFIVCITKENKHYLSLFLQSERNLSICLSLSLFYYISLYIHTIATIHWIRDRVVPITNKIIFTRWRTSWYTLGDQELAWESQANLTLFYDIRFRNWEKRWLPEVGEHMRNLSNNWHQGTRKTPLRKQKIIRRLLTRPQVASEKADVNLKYDLREVNGPKSSTHSKPEENSINFFFSEKNWVLHHPGNIHEAGQPLNMSHLHQQRSRYWPNQLYQGRNRLRSSRAYQCYQWCNLKMPFLRSQVPRHISSNRCHNNIPLRTWSSHHHWDNNGLLQEFRSILSHNWQQLPGAG